ARHIASVSMSTYCNCKFILNQLATLKATVGRDTQQSFIDKLAKGANQMPHLAEECKVHWVLERG
ncbi:MAG: hypothetical protein ACLFM7_10180, partial [Bacteroidales bacterium]